MGRLFLPNIKMLSGKSLSIKKSNALSHTSFFLLILWGPIVGLRPPGPSLSGSFKQGMLGKEERQANYAKKLPYNFSWIEPRRLAGTSIPSTVAQLEGLVREGVSHLVSLSPETPPLHPHRGLSGANSKPDRQVPRDRRQRVGGQRGCRRSLQGRQWQDRHDVGRFLDTRETSSS